MKAVVDNPEYKAAKFEVRWVGHHGPAELWAPRFNKECPLETWLDPRKFKEFMKENAIPPFIEKEFPDL